MRENFQNIDGKKLEIVHEIKSAYDEGRISLEEARKALKDRVQHLAPYEIAIIEQEMVEETEDECIKEDIQAMLEVFQDILVTKDQEFRYMAEGDREIGFAYITVEPEKSPKQNISHTASQSTSPLSGLSSAPGFAEELAGLLGKYGFNNKEEKLNVSTGQLTLEQINLIYQHMPVDLSYVDENELVCFYTDTKHRVFPRSKNVIGRDVKNCHPKASVHIVEEIIKKFRSGEQDKAEFWINKPDLFIYIIYYAVRDENGKFRGVLEMMQDCTHIRSLQGSQTLLTWEQQEKGESKETSEDEDKREGSETSEDVGNKESAGTLGDEENRESTESLTAGKLTEITEDTLLKDILEADPNVKTLLFRLSDRFKALNTPLARIMMPKATVKIMSERAEVDLDTLLRELREYFKL